MKSSPSPPAGSPDPQSPEQLARACYTAYERKDRAAIEALLAEDFTFTSPLDDAISRDRYMERCWPNSEHLNAFEIQNLMVQEDKVFVQYKAHARGQAPFKNTELFTIRDGRIQSVEVYFGAEEADAQSASEEEIRKTIEAWAEGIRRKDVEMVASRVPEDSVRYYLAPPLVATEPVRENLREWFDTFEGPIGYEIRDLQITAGGGVAYTHSLHHLTGRKRAGEEVDLWFRETLCLRRIDGAWAITHAHESVPFLMDGSGKAALDLKP